MTFRAAVCEMGDVWQGQRWVNRFVKVMASEKRDTERRVSCRRGGAGAKEVAKEEETGVVGVKEAMRPAGQFGPSPPREQSGRQTAPQRPSQPREEVLGAEVYQPAPHLSHALSW